MHKHRQRVVANACKQVHHCLAGAVQAAHAHALSDVAGGEHAGAGVQVEGYAVLPVLYPGMAAVQLLGLAVPGACRCAPCLAICFAVVPGCICCNASAAEAGPLPSYCQR